jgi:hypothetical protein
MTFSLEFVLPPAAERPTRPSYAIGRGFRVNNPSNAQQGQATPQPSGPGCGHGPTCQRRGVEFWVTVALSPFGLGTTRSRCAGRHALQVPPCAQQQQQQVPVLGLRGTVQPPRWLRILPPMGQFTRTRVKKGRFHYDPPDFLVDVIANDVSVFPKLI